MHELGRELYVRIATMSGHLTDAGKGLDNAVEALQRSGRSLESRVLVQARRFEEHADRRATPAHRRRSSEQAIPLQAPELAEPGEQLRAIDAA